MRAFAVVAFCATPFLFGCAHTETVKRIDSLEKGQKNHFSLISAMANRSWRTDRRFVKFAELQDEVDKTLIFHIKKLIRDYQELSEKYAAVELYGNQLEKKIDDLEQEVLRQKRASAQKRGKKQ